MIQCGCLLQSLSMEKADICVLHDEFVAYIVTFFSDVCRHICNTVAAQKTNVPVHLDQEIVQGIKAVGNSDKMQMSEDAVYTANFCATTARRQPSTLSTKSKCCQEINQTVG
jgi:hypothetical protein